MPLYEYECEQCKARFEVIQRFSDSPIEACRVCGGPVHKLISAAAIHFKGTGWYVTDYGKKNGSGSSPSSSHSSQGSESKTDTASPPPATPPPAAPPSTSSSDTSSSTTDKKSERR